MQTIAIYERRVILKECPLPTGLHHREIKLRIWRKAQYGTFGQFQTGIALKMYRSLQIVCACRHHNVQSAILLRLRHSLFECRQTIFLSVALSAVFQNVHFLLWHMCTCNDGEDGIPFRRVVTTG